MSNASRWRAVVVVLVLAGAVALVATRPARLGLDLQGGTQIVLEAQDTDRVKVTGDVASRTLEVLRRRVDALGVAEPTLQRSGDRRIIIELPGVADPDEALAVIGRTAQLAFHQVEAIEPPAAAGMTTTTVPGESQPLVLTGERGERLRLSPSAVTGEAVGTARASLQGELSSSWQVEIDFRGDGEEQWADLTSKAACADPGSPARRVAIALDKDVISSPAVGDQVQCGQGITGGTTVITGQFTHKEAKDLALLIRAGALPVPVEVVERRTVGPTLGDAAIDASVRAAIIGAALTVLYMILYYRLLGVLAALTLAAYGVISYAVLLGLNATLTLPGIAGFVLAIGMAVDANVLVFERIKEEHAAGASVRTAVRNGFRNAWSAIADSNATTVLAAVLLFFFATGAVRGFGVTLTVGVVVSIFCALVLTRLLAELVASSRRLSARPRLLGLDVGGRFRAWIERRRPNVLRHSGRWLLLSGLVVALAITGLVTRGLDYGLDFSGGRLMEFSTAGPADLDRVRDAVGDAGFPKAVVQASGDGDVAVRTEQLTKTEAERVQAAVERAAGKAEIVRDEFVGPTIGNELRRKAVIALGLALLVQLAFLAVRFRFTFGAAAVLAMFHDMVILLGLFAWLGKSADGVFVAAVLTVIGYSINDSVVVFDRIRELRRLRPRDPMADVANDACLQTVPRTLNTGLGAMFILVALYALGGATLTDFALALLVGILVGTYSSVFTAAPLLVRFEGGGRGVRGGNIPAPAAEPRVLVPAGASNRTRGTAGPSAPPSRGPAPPRPRKKRKKGAKRR
jgi:SecD/SecF fusion protein